MDVDCISDLNPSGKEVTESSELAQYVAHRVTTTRGSLAYETDWGIDVYSYAGANVPLSVVETDAAVEVHREQGAEDALVRVTQLSEEEAQVYIRIDGVDTTVDAATVYRAPPPVYVPDSLNPALVGLTVWIDGDNYDGTTATGKASLGTSGSNNAVAYNPPWFSTPARVLHASGHYYFEFSFLTPGHPVDGFELQNKGFMSEDSRTFFWQAVMRSRIPLNINDSPIISYNCIFSAHAFAKVKLREKTTGEHVIDFSWTGPAFYYGCVEAFEIPSNTWGVLQVRGVPKVGSSTDVTVSLRWDGGPWTSFDYTPYPMGPAWNTNNVPNEIGADYGYPDKWDLLDALTCPLPISDLQADQLYNFMKSRYSL